MAQIVFEDRAVAFVDVLGFKTIVNNAVTDADALKQLHGLVDLLSSAVPNLDRTVDHSVSPRLIPAHTYISDTIILSSPLSDSSVSSYNGLETLVMRCIQLTHHLLKAGYLIRGGVAIGKVWHGESNIVGPAYQEAYLLETKVGKPRIVLSDNAVEHWKQGYCYSSRMCVERDGSVMVNGLHDFYIPENTMHGVIEQTYDDYKKIAQNAINSDLPQTVKDKWIWFRDYLETESREGRM